MDSEHEGRLCNDRWTDLNAEGLSAVFAAYVVRNTAAGGDGDVGGEATRGRAVIGQ